MTTGSVRGKCCALQTSHSRRQPAAAGRVGGAAIGAEAVARVPGEDRLGLAEHGERVRARPAPARRSSADRSARGRRGRGRPAAAGRGSRRCRRRSARPRRPAAAPRTPARRRLRSRAAPRTARRRGVRLRRAGRTAPGAPRRAAESACRARSATAFASGRARSAATEAASSRRSETRSSGAPRKPNAGARAAVLKKASFMLHPSSGRRWPSAAKPVLIRANRPGDSLTGKRAAWVRQSRGAAR